MPFISFQNASSGSVMNFATVFRFGKFDVVSVMVNLN
jgi:hypothetical protein